ncbi:CFI-box-CTERM domain-containing protein [Candidatus Nitrosotenuis sp. DW1]|uniref:CFI-box-CTERM domain-containing protein n=1 Tax=Candidatus Nitrosotenuis sp. DW1 TaxID=2259672 RepID=UPI0015CDCB52|nr:CFI-box-CTERM domain-containing protein [Candidatus Nitrosotenuis sp. DW1]QLH08212.1 copper-binding protein [Candidatus Nitrosotenuis sp. DW1]
MKYFVALFLLPFLVLPAFADQFQSPTDKGTLLVSISTDPAKPVLGDLTKLKIDFINPKTNNIQEHIDYKVTVTKDGVPIFGPIPLTHTSEGAVTIPVQFKENGEHKIIVDIEGILFQPIPSETVTFTEVIDDASVKTTDEDGSCIIATAAYGSELAPQVQLLREVRDNVLFSTDSGTVFMHAFNALYYSFSPTVADVERQSPIFKETVKLAITPMLSTLSILNYVNIDSEGEMLGYGIGIILLNVGMYFVVPAIVISKIRNFRK